MRRDLALIHGWGFDRRIWTALIPYLEDKWRVHCVDLPGYGAVGDRIVTDLDRMAQAIDHDVPGHAHILAWSLGGLVATQLACARADIGALVLIAGSPCFIKKPDWPHGIETAAFDRLVMHLDKDRKSALAEFATLAALGDPRPRETLQTLTTYLDDGQPTLATLKAGLVLLREADLRGSMGWQRVNGMILGEKDRLVPLSVGAAMQAIHRKIRTITVAKTGHALFLSRPKATAVAVGKIIESQYDD